MKISSNSSMCTCTVYMCIFLERMLPFHQLLRILDGVKFMYTCTCTRVIQPYMNCINTIDLKSTNVSFVQGAKLYTNLASRFKDNFKSKMNSIWHSQKKQEEKLV